MQSLRTVIFWMHLGAGVVAGVAILVMSVTGAALALKPQILSAVEKDVRFVSPPVAGSRLGVQALLASVQRAQGVNGANFGTNLPGTLTIDEWGYYLNQLCSGMADQYKLNADALFPGRDDRGGPLNWSAFAGYASQAGLSAYRRRARRGALIGTRVVRRAA